MHKIIWTTTQKKLDELIPWDKNPRKVSDKQAHDIEKSLSTFGLCEPIVINRDNTIIGGHQRVQLLKKLHYTCAEVSIPSTLLTPSQVEELALRLNKNHASWDYDILANNFEIDTLLEIGWDYKDLGMLDDLIDSEPLQQTKQDYDFPCTMEIVFNNKNQLEEAQQLILPILEKFEGMSYISSI